MIIKKGYTILEALTSMIILGFVSLALATFVGQSMNASYINSQQLEKIDFTRFTVDRILEEIKKAEYIYPSNIALTLVEKDPLDSTKSKSITVNTTNAIALLIPTAKQNLKYRATVFYIETVEIKKDPNSNEVCYYYNLREFNGETDYSWAKNSIPAESMLTLNGNSQILASNIDNASTSLNYILSNNNGLSDYSLKGDISSTAATSTKALISGIKWRIYINKLENEEITINGLSHNIPRFIEE